MPIDPIAVHRRWEKMRGLPECDLSLEPTAVARYLGESEPSIVKQRILETLVHFADYRLSEEEYHTGKEKGGDLATCEGLEAFLEPAVEEAHRFSEFLQTYNSADKFATAFTKDLTGLIKSWTEAQGIFSGKPYMDVAKLKRAIETTSHSLYAPFNITESAAMACRVAIHVLTLKYHSREEDGFLDAIGKNLDDELLFKALSNAIAFLVDAFQKNPTGKDTEERIAKATWGAFAGSGWSWTACPPDTAPLPPMLFFTAAAVDAFAEIDLYLIRRACSKNPADCAPRMRQFYNENLKNLNQFQLCVDMARRWVRAAVLDNLTSGVGQYPEKYADRTPMHTVVGFPDSTKKAEIESFEDRWKQAGLAHPPTLYYNNLYALQILLWSFGDRTDDGEAVDDVAKSLINRAITLLVYQYDSVPVAKELLLKASHKFLLPGKGVFKDTDESADCDYEDAGFLPLLTRLLVLFVVYGVGDRNLLEPIVRDLYVELLQRRNREAGGSYGALWSTDRVEVYSTQRAIQALTFYYAYAAGKDLVENRKAGGIGSDDFVFLNKTGRRLVMEFTDGGLAPVTDSPPGARTDGKLARPESMDPAVLFKGTFGEDIQKYVAKNKCLLPGPNDWEPAKLLQTKVQGLIMEVFAAGGAGNLRDPAVAKMIIDGLLSLWKDPADGRRVKDAEFDLLKRLYLSVSGSESDSAAI